MNYKSLPWRTCLIYITLCIVVPFGGAVGQPVDSVAQAISLFDSSRYVECRELLDAYLPNHPRDALAASYRGRVALVENDLDLSVDWGKQSVEFDEGNAAYHLWLGRAYGMKAQKASKINQAFLARKVKHEFERAVELNPNLVEARMALLEYYLMAPGIMGGSQGKALEQAQKIRQLDPVNGHRAYVLIYEDQKEYDQAKEEYLTAIRENPDKLSFQYQLGYFYQRTEQYEAAFALFEEIHAAHPEAMNALYQIGRTGALSGMKLDRAEACLQQYLQGKPGPDDPALDGAHFRLGQVYEKSGQKESARQEYEAALNLNPEHKQAREALKKLK